MRLYKIAFNGMDENAVGRIVTSHGGKLYAINECYVYYLATEKTDTEILLELVNRRLL